MNSHSFSIGWEPVKYKSRTLSNRMNVGREVSLVSEIFSRPRPMIPLLKITISYRKAKYVLLICRRQILYLWVWSMKDAKIKKTLDQFEGKYVKTASVWRNFRWSDEIDVPLAPIWWADVCRRRGALPKVHRGTDEQWIPICFLPR